MIPTPPKPRYIPGSRLRVTQNVRVGHRRWRTEVEGSVEAESYRPIGGIEMGGKATYCFQPTLKLRRDDGEVVVVALDDESVVTDLSQAAGAAPHKEG